MQIDASYNSQSTIAITPSRLVRSLPVAIQTISTSLLTLLSSPATKMALMLSFGAALAAAKTNSDSNDKSCLSTIIVSDAGKEYTYRITDSDKCDFVNRVTECFWRSSGGINWRTARGTETLGNGLRAFFGGDKVYDAPYPDSGYIEGLDGLDGVASRALALCGEAAAEQRSLARERLWTVIGWTALSLCAVYIVCASCIAIVAMCKKAGSASSSSIASRSYSLPARQMVGEGRIRRQSQRTARGTMTWAV